MAVSCSFLIMEVSSASSFLVFRLCSILYFDCRLSQHAGVLVHRQLEFRGPRVSELVRASCHSDRGLVPRRFSAWVPIPKVVGRQSAGWRTAAPSVLAPESALGSLLSVALSSAQAMGRCNPRLVVRQPLWRRPGFVVCGREHPPAFDRAVRGSSAPSHSACRPA